MIDFGTDLDNNSPAVKPSALAPEPLGPTAAARSRHAFTSSFLRRVNETVKTLFDYLAAGDPLERFLEHFPDVTHEQAAAVIKQTGAS